jgi:hypothetical protein
MPRFNVGDTVAVLQRFALSYPSDSGVIIAIKPDLFRPAFDEYTVRFPCGLTANLFEFQLAEVAS